MWRGLLKLLLVAAAAGFLFYVGLGSQDKGTSRSAASSASQTATKIALGRATQTWGNPASLPDHFARHGADFDARSADDYARMAAQFLQRAKAEGLPAKVDGSGAFGAYNRDGTTKTFFKPGSRGYFERQPGQLVDLRTWR